MENKYWPLESRANKTFKTSGSDNKGINTYTYNEIGYRGDSVNSNIEMLAAGCSHTEGIEVNDTETWPYLTAQSLGIKHINLGFTGRSNDYISRAVNTYVKQFRPKIVTVMYTYPSRREYWTEYGPQPFAINPWGYFTDNHKKYLAHIELSSQEEDKQNFIKNHEIVKLTCELYNAKLVWNGTFLPFEYRDSNRFDGGYKVEEGKHATAEQNKDYSEKLVGYLKNNSYL